MPLPWPNMVSLDLNVSKNVPVFVTLPITDIVPFSVNDTSVLCNLVSLRILMPVSLPAIDSYKGFSDESVVAGIFTVLEAETALSKKKARTKTA